MTDGRIVEPPVFETGYFVGASPTLSAINEMSFNSRKLGSEPINLGANPSISANPILD